MKTIFQSESHGGNELKGSAVILVDGAIEEVFSPLEYTIYVHS